MGTGRSRSPLLPVAHVEEAVVPVEIGGVQGVAFGAADTGTVERLQHGPAAKARGFARVGHGQHSEYLGGGERAGKA